MKKILVLLLLVVMISINVSSTVISHSQSIPNIRLRNGDVGTMY